VLREGRDEILQSWRRFMRGRPVSRTSLDREESLDDLPGLLDDIADHVERQGTAPQARLRTANAEAHAVHRLAEGIPLHDVVSELLALRECAQGRWREHRPGKAAPENTDLIGRSIDEALAASVKRYADSRDHVVHAFDRISAAARESRGLDELLQRLLDVILGAAPSLPAGGDRATAGIVQHQLRQALEHNAAELAAVLASIPEPVIVADHQGLRSANTAALRLLGLSSMAEARHRNPRVGVLFEARDAASGEPVPLHRRPLVRALLGEPVRQELLVRRADSSEELIVRAQSAPVRVRGRVVAAVLVLSDLTSERRAEQERERLFSEARQAVADRKHVLAIVSHDLRNPLGVIVSGAALLQQGEIDQDAGRRTVAVMTRAAARMNRMVRDLLDVSSIEAGRLTVDPRPLDPRTVVSECVEAACAEATERGCSVESDVEPPLPLVRADRDRLVQVLGNLMGNAFKVTPPGGRITVGVRAHEQGVVYSVRDSGPGLAAEARARLFEPYWRGTRSYKGTGLGLAIARGIVEAHGGRIWADSEPGRGSTFSFTVPAA
jgi:signal transduction histidine kinase